MGCNAQCELSFWINMKNNFYWNSSRDLITIQKIMSAMQEIFLFTLDDNINTMKVYFTIYMVKKKNKNCDTIIPLENSIILSCLAQAEEGGGAKIDIKQALKIGIFYIFIGGIWNEIYPHYPILWPVMVTISGQSFGGSQYAIVRNSAQSTR